MKNPKAPFVVLVGGNIAKPIMRRVLFDPIDPRGFVDQAWKKIQEADGSGSAADNNSDAGVQQQRFDGSGGESSSEGTPKMVFAYADGERFNPADPWDVDTLYIFSLCETMAGRPPPCLRARLSGQRWIDFLPYDASTAEWRGGGGSGRKGRRKSAIQLGRSQADHPDSPRRRERTSSNQSELSAAAAAVDLETFRTQSSSSSGGGGVDGRNHAILQNAVTQWKATTTTAPVPAHLAHIELEEPDAATWYGRLWQRHKRYVQPPDYIENDEISDCIPSLEASNGLNRFLEISSLVIILVSVATFCIETLPEYRLNPATGEEYTDNHPIFYPIEAACVSWFTIEYLWRLFVSPDKWAFLIDGLNVVDLIAILPFYISFGLSSDNASQLTIVRILRLSRVSRLFKVSRHSSGLQDMITCIGASKAELALFFLITIVATILFASAIFYAEKDEPGTPYISIPASFWWAIVTMTTVGYGDLVPSTIVGRCIGAVCASLGVVLLAIPAGIFISEFMTLHEQKKREKALGSNADLDATLEYHLQDALNVCQLMEVAHNEKHKDDNAEDGQPEEDDELDVAGTDQILDPSASTAFFNGLSTAKQWTVVADDDEGDKYLANAAAELLDTSAPIMELPFNASDVASALRDSPSRSGRASSSTSNETESGGITPVDPFLAFGGAVKTPNRAVNGKALEKAVSSSISFSIPDGAAYAGVADVDTDNDDDVDADADADNNNVAAPLPSFYRSSTHDTEPGIEPVRVVGVSPSSLQPALNGRSYLSVTNL